MLPNPALPLLLDGGGLGHGLGGGVELGQLCQEGLGVAQFAGESPSSES